MSALKQLFVSSFLFYSLWVLHNEYDIYLYFLFLSFSSFHPPLPKEGFSNLASPDEHHFSIKKNKKKKKDEGKRCKSQIGHHIHTYLHSCERWWCTASYTELTAKCFFIPFFFSKRDCNQSTFTIYNSQSSSYNTRIGKL